MATYTVRHGDTLWDIAEDNGMSLRQLLQLNPQFANNPNRIFAGQTLNLSAGATPVGRTSPAANTSSPLIQTNGPAPTPVYNAPGVNVNLGGPAPSNGGGISVGLGPDNTYQNLLNQLSGMNGTNRDAFAALNTLFSSYGLESLAPKIIEFLQQGMGSDTITSLLQQTPEYKARFSGNTARVANGLQVLTPAEYLSTEASYRQVLQSAGLDPAFMNRTQYSQWIGDDIAPTEIQNRVNLAVNATTNAPPELTRAFGQIGITIGDLASYFLNDKNPMPILQQKMSQAQIIEAGLQSGVPSVNNANALQYAKMGVTYNQALSGYQKVSDVLTAANNLTSIYGNQNPYGQTQAEQEFLGNSGQAQFARESLGRQETATFQGEGGIGQKSFAQQTAGTGF